MKTILTQRSQRPQRQSFPPLRSPRPLRLSYQAILEDLGKTMDILKRVIKRHRSDADDVRLAPVGENPSANELFVKRSVRIAYADGQLAAALITDH